MRLPLFCTLLLAACAGGDKAAETTEATAPAGITPADLAGTWTGASKAAGSDSVISSWTSTSTSDSTGTLTATGGPEVPYTVAYSGDSIIATSAAYVDPAIGTDMIMWQSIGRLEGPGVLSGTFTTMLAAKHDSILVRGTWRSTKNP